MSKENSDVIFQKKANQNPIDIGIDWPFEISL